MLNEHRMDGVEESSYPDILLELGLSSRRGGLLKGQVALKMLEKT